MAGLRKASTAMPMPSTPRSTPSHQSPSAPRPWKAASSEKTPSTSAKTPNTRISETSVMPGDTNATMPKAIAASPRIRITHQERARISAMADTSAGQSTRGAARQGGLFARSAARYAGAPSRRPLALDPASLTDVRYEVERGLAVIEIHRPERLNAFRAHTVDELIRCFKAAWADRAVGVIGLT